MLPPISFPHFPEPAKSAPNKKAKIAESSEAPVSSAVPSTFKDGKLVENDLSEAPDVGMATGGQVSLVGTGSDLEMGVPGCACLWK